MDVQPSWQVLPSNADGTTGTLEPSESTGPCLTRRAQRHSEARVQHMVLYGLHGVVSQHGCPVIRYATKHGVVRLLGYISTCLHQSDYRNAIRLNNTIHVRVAYSNGRGLLS